MQFKKYTTMKKSYVVFDFLKFPVPGKVAKGRNVLLGIDSNPIFVTPDIPLTDLKASTDELENSFLAAQHGGKEATVRLHKAEATWDYQMRLEARYVERIAVFDEAIILSSGFSVSRQPGPLQKPELDAENGDLSGSVLLRRQAVPGAKSYVWQYCYGTLSQTEEGWTDAGITTKASKLLNGLDPVVRHWFRVAVVTKDGTSAYCDPIMHVVV
jgi:hypothetical protein